MFKFFDRWVEAKLRQRFEKRRLAIVEKMVDRFLKRNPNFTNQVELIDKIVKEDTRVHIITDKSLLRAGIKRAKYTFLGTASTSIIIIGSLGAFSTGSIFPFVAPLASAFVAMLISLSTIEIPYEQRVKAGYASVIATCDPAAKEKERETLTFLLKRFLSDAKEAKTQVEMSPPTLATATPVKFHLPPDDQICPEHAIDVRAETDTEKRLRLAG